VRPGPRERERSVQGLLTQDTRRFSIPRPAPARGRSSRTGPGRVASRRPTRRAQDISRRSRRLHRSLPRNPSASQRAKCSSCMRKPDSREHLPGAAMAQPVRATFAPGAGRLLPISGLAGPPAAWSCPSGNPGASCPRDGDCTILVIKRRFPGPRWPSVGFTPALAPVPRPAAPHSPDGGPWGWPLAAPGVPREGRSTR